MKKKIILVSIILIISLGIIFCSVDYNKVKSGEMPLFVIAQHDKRGPEINYFGLGYRVVRNPGVSYKQPIYSDNYVKFGFWFYTWKIKMNKPAIDYIRIIETSVTKNCDEKEVLYYALSDKDIYTYCLDSVKIKENNKPVELKDYIVDNPDIIDEISNAITVDTIYKDGGTTLYRDNGVTEYTNNGIAIIKCNTIDGNRDIYIGPKNMEYKNNFCKSDIKKNNTFIKTYHVLNVAESNDENYQYLTLRQFQVDEVVTVKVSKTITLNIEENKIYEFNFNRVGKKIEDNIKSIFENGVLLSVEETDKTGLNQIQESVE